MIILSRLLCALAVLALLMVPATSVADDDDDDDYPSAGALVAADVTHAGARLSGTLEPGRSDTTWWVEYSASGNAVSSTAHVEVAGDRKHKPVTVSTSLSGLPAVTRVSARLVASSSDENDSGRWLSFTTGATPPADLPPAPTPAPPAAPAAPVLGEQVVVAAEQGQIRVKPPGSDGFVALEQAASLPVGTVVDARGGTLALRTALADGGVQQGSFWGARFKVAQRADGNGRIDLRLRGGGFDACRETSRTLASAASNAPKKVRRLWGKDHGGRYRTHGRDSVATVRGTEWSVTDRCDGTATKVTEGAVDVKVRRSGRVVRVEAGERHFARRHG